MNGIINTIWIFHGANGRFSSGVFSSLKNGESWIKKHKLSGVLTEYPIDEGIFDWSVRNNFFEPKNSNEKDPNFIQKFSCANQEHYHYEDGEKDL